MLLTLFFMLLTLFFHISNNYVYRCQIEKINTMIVLSWVEQESNGHILVW